MKKKIFKKRFPLKIISVLIILQFSLKYSLFAENLPGNELQSCTATPDMIFYNGTIITMDPDNPLTEALAVRSDTITFTGSNEEILSLVEPGCGAKIIDLGGLTILPGFNDSHSHWFSWREHICSVTGDTTYPSLEEIMDMLSQNGWTSISELNFGRPDYAPEHLNNALDLDARGKLSVRLNGYWGTYDDVSMIDVLADSMRLPDRDYSDRIHAPGVKIYVDDPFGYSDILTQGQVNQLVQRAHEAGWQIAAHAVNESAVEKILTAYENVLGAESNENYRYRIEHAVKVSDDQLTRMRQKGIIASFQLLGPADWPNQPDFGSRFSNTNPEWVLRWKDFVEADGLRITGSTDAPFNDAPCDYSPFRIIYQAVTRKGYVDRPLADWELAQRLTVENCLKLLTIDGAYATFEENDKGSLIPGKWADLVVVSNNPLEVPSPEDLLDIKVLLTMVGGQIEYCDNTENSDLCTSLNTYVVDSTLITASKYLPDQTPNLAYDNNTDTNWGSGDFPPQWIQFDLRDEFHISGIDLVIDQWPQGQTVHQIWAGSDDPADNFKLLHEFSENTTADQVLSYTAPSDLAPYRYFRILTTQSPSWVSWKEIRIYKQDVTSAVDGNNGSIPRSLVLMQNHPNPFNPNTTITYGIPESLANQTARLEIYNLQGQKIRTLVEAKQSTGNHSVRWEGRDSNGARVSSGAYLYKLSVGPFVKIRKMLFLK